jgi:hypothetical protein
MFSGHSYPRAFKPAVIRWRPYRGFTPAWISSMGRPGYRGGETMASRTRAGRLRGDSGEKAGDSPASHGVAGRSNRVASSTQPACQSCFTCGPSR